ncbi:hypothetical protein [Paracnuella aquatica]|uniref:hypothetical protein n=1 Tax=Paracnuella aquatica TaxID=2268757 RepID=UPI0012D72CD9|nr:hypothetical protein [Paracnuella aquatica]
MEDWKKGAFEYASDSAFVLLGKVSQPGYFPVINKEFRKNGGLCGIFQDKTVLSHG